MMLKNNWRASKLMGLDVYNEANEKLGDINELILDKNGKVQRRGYRRRRLLGYGRARHRRYDGQAQIHRGTGPHQLTPRPRRAKRRPARPRRLRTHTTTTTTTARTHNANDWTPDHAVMSGTKEQLKATAAVQILGLQLR